MKILRILLVFAIAFGMMACNNEEVPQVNGDKDASISIKVFPSSDSPSFRAVGNLSGDGIIAKGLDAESAIKSLEVWVFRTSDGVLTGYGEATTSEVKNISAIAGPSTIVVVANAEIGIKASKADLLDEFKELPVSDITDGGLVMTAEPLELTLYPGNNYYGYSADDVTDPVTPTYHSTDAMLITRVNARVAIVSAILDYENVPKTQQAMFTHLKNIQVAMFNVPNKTKLFGASLATNTDFQFGGALWPSSKFTYVGAGAGLGTSPSNTILYNPLTDLVFPTSQITVNDAPYYYVNENTSKLGAGTEADPRQQMLIVLRGQPFISMSNEDGAESIVPVTSLSGLYTDADGYTYYPVWVNLDGLTASGNVGNGNVYRNTQYNISLTIKGLGNPTIDPVDKAWLDVKVVVAPWIVVKQEITW